MRAGQTGLLCVLVMPRVGRRRQGTAKEGHEICIVIGIDSAFGRACSLPLDWTVNNDATWT